MTVIDYNHELGGWGRKGDEYMAHVQPGDTVVPPVISDELRKKLYEEMQAYGVDPKQYTVGDGMSINPMTGLPEFGLGKSLKKAVKKVGKVVKSIAQSPIGQIAIPAIASVALPGIGSAIGVNISAAAGAAIGSGLATKAAGGSWGQAIGAGLGSYVGSGIGGPGTGNVGSNLANAGLNDVANFLGRNLGSGVTGASISSITGGMIGSSLGAAAGGMIDPPKVKGWTGESANMPVATNGIPATPATVAVPVGNSTGGDTPQRGSGVSSTGYTSPQYTATVRDRDTGANRTINTTFSNNYDRRNGWGNAISFA